MGLAAVDLVNARLLEYVTDGHSEENVRVRADCHCKFLAHTNPVYIGAYPLALMRQGWQQFRF